MKLNTGVYLIKNKINGDCYIGSASKPGKSKKSSGFRVRFIKHQRDLKNKNHCNNHLQRAWNKYGKDNFSFSILAKCPPEYCLKLEQYFIDNMNPAYNICKIAGSKLGTTNSLYTRDKISKSNKGRIFSEEHKIKIGLSNRKENNPERCKILSMALSGRKLSDQGLKDNREKRRLHKSITKFSMGDIISIKIMIRNNINLGYISKNYNVSISCISDIKHNRTWRDIKI